MTTVVEEEEDWPPARADWKFSFTPDDQYYVEVHKFRVTNFMSFNAAPPQEHDLPQLLEKHPCKVVTHCYHNWHYYNIEHRYAPGNLEVYVDPTVYIITLTSMTHDGQRNCRDATKCHDSKIIYEYEHNVYVFSPYMIDTTVDVKTNTTIKCQTRQNGCRLYHLHGHTHSLVLTHAGSKDKKRMHSFGMVARVHK
ncbi:hypothetical protein SELMODRAFT_406459 [Selaginella moellendorffii]|uniref:Uncharacterized protein n=1 Tax=Selaginella moellendorffii TaxID=88036 RepID=D8R2F3_SELML|nr:hypothetical protein SELMODRAFT_406459 [Selaginella moellendorffii]